MIFFQLALTLLILLLDFGLLGRQTGPYFSPTLGLILVWAFSWFGQERDAFRFAVLVGLSFELVSFLPTLSWLVIFVGTFVMTDLLRRRFFEAQSLPLALTTLVAASVWMTTILGVVTKNFDLMALGGAVTANCLIGILLYYFVGIRFKFLQRWAGRRL